MTRQTLMLKKMKELAEEAGFNFIRNPKWANTGNIELLTDDMVCRLRFCYDFQSDSMTFQFYPGNKEAVATCGFTHKDCIKDVYIEHHENKKVKEILDWYEKKLENIIKEEITG